MTDYSRAHQWDLDRIRERDGEWIEGIGGLEALPAHMRTDLDWFEIPTEEIDRHELLVRLDALTAAVGTALEQACTSDAKRRERP